MVLSSMAFQVTSNGPPNGPEPPTSSRPPLIVAKWICTEAAWSPCTPLVMVPLLPGCSSSPSTNVAPGFTNKPPLMVTGPSLMHTAPAGTTTVPYEPGFNVVVHVVVAEALAGSALGKTTTAALIATALNRRTK